MSTHFDRSRYVWTASTAIWLFSCITSGEWWCWCIFAASAVLACTLWACWWQEQEENEH